MTLSDEAKTTILRALYQAVLQRSPAPHEVQSWLDQFTADDRLEAVVKSFITSEEYLGRTGVPKVPMFVPPGHFYSPVVAPNEIGRHFDKHDDRVAALAGIDIDLAEMKRLWEELTPFLKKMPFNDKGSKRYAYYFENPSFGYADGAVLHSMILRHQPKRLIEVGSGWSSACVVDTVSNFLSGKCTVNLIDPYTDTVSEILPVTPPFVKIVRSAIQNISVASFAVLERNDILFIDSTHVAKTNSDVVFELFEILPKLQPGVLVHFHDIFWPFEYPKYWAVNENRSWNEVYFLRAFLTNNETFKILFFNDYFSKFAEPEIQAVFPAFMKNTGGSLWLQKT